MVTTCSEKVWIGTTRHACGEPLETSEEITAQRCARHLVVPASWSGEVHARRANTASTETLWLRHRAHAGEVLYYALYYAPKDFWSEFTKIAPTGVMRAFWEAQSVFGTIHDDAEPEDV